MVSTNFSLLLYLIIYDCWLELENRTDQNSNFKLYKYVRTSSAYIVQLK